MTHDRTTYGTPRGTDDVRNASPTRRTRPDPGTNASLGTKSRTTNPSSSVLVMATATRETNQP